MGGFTVRTNFLQDEQEFTHRSKESREFPETVSYILVSFKRAHRLSIIEILRHLYEEFVLDEATGFPSLLHRYILV